MKAPMLAAITAKLETIQQRSPKDFEAFGVIVDHILDRLKKDASAERGVRGRILARLQQRHECRTLDGGVFDQGFEQLEPLGPLQPRRWQCIGCGKIVTLEDGA